MDELDKWQEGMKIAMEEFVAAERAAVDALDKAYFAMIQGDARTEQLIADWRRLDGVREEKKAAFFRAREA